MGYDAVFVYEKYRTEWSFALESGAMAHLVVDETPIGKLCGARRAYGLDRPHASSPRHQPRCLPDGQLWEAFFWTGSSGRGAGAENLTFAEIGAPVLAPQ